MPILICLRWIYETFYTRNDRDISHTFDMDVVVWVFLNSLPDPEFIGAIVELQNFPENFVLKHQSFNQSVSSSRRADLRSRGCLRSCIFLYLLSIDFVILSRSFYVLFVKYIVFFLFIIISL